MKHCAKKLLGLAFALALCLAVGGTALAQTPEFADVPAALPEQEMLDYEPNVTAEPGTTSTGDLEREGYTVTIPTTVTVESGTDKETLMVTADVRQMRTLTITLDSKNDWQLEHESGQAQAGYSLTSEDAGYSDGGNVWYREEVSTGGKKKLKLHLPVGQKAVGDFDVNWKDRFTIPLTVAVDPSQATMSGTYSDTVSFAFAFTHKSCVTYFINVYEQELQLTADGKSVEAVDMVNADGTVKPGAKPVHTEILEYPTGNDKEYPWNYSSDEADAALRWEKATATMNTHQDVNGMTSNKVDANNNVTINLNRRYKWYWLDVNGATDYNGEDIGGNQGEHIGSFVEIMLSVDGDNWTDWFWQGDGDDYWAKLPYGIHFKLGLHHVKNGYVYDTGTGTLKGNGVRIIANKKEEYTATGEPVGGSTYYVYTGQMTGAPTGKDGYNNDCYCYIPCYKKGLTYIANDGTGGTESVNVGNPPRSNVLYEDGGTLKTPEDLEIDAPTGKSFAGWSTKPTYTKGETLYQPGDNVKDVVWETYTDTSKRPELNGEIDDERRELYAIWGYKVDIKIQFEDETGYTDSTAQVHEGGIMDDTTYSVTLYNQKVLPGSSWTLDLSKENVPEQVKTAIDTATNYAKTMAEDTDTTTTDADFKYKVWKLADKFVKQGDCSITVPSNVAAGDTLTLTIKRRRYLLSVLSTDADTGVIADLVTTDTAKYGTFNVVVNSTSVATEKSFYQCGWNYGASYTVSNVKANTGFNSMDMLILQSLTKGENVTAYDSNLIVNLKGTAPSYSSYVTEKQKDIHYYKTDGSILQDSGGEPVRVIFYNTTATAKPGPSLAPAKKALTVRYHANFDPIEELALDLDQNPLLEDMDDTFGFDPDPLPEDVDDALEEVVKTVRYKPGEDVVLRNCMFKRGGYVFVGWNTEPDGTGRLYRVNGVPITDWAAGDTVDLYAQWKKPDHLKPVVDSEPFVPADPDTPPERIDDGFDAAFGVDPAAQPEGMDDAFGIDPDPLPEELDDAFGV